MKAYWVSGQLHTLASLPPGKKPPWYQLDMRLGGPQSWSGCSGEEKYSQPLLGLKTPIIQPIAMPMSYPGSMEQVMKI
jgi:hypothetical protein